MGFPTAAFLGQEEKRRLALMQEVPPRDDHPERLREKHPKQQNLPSFLMSQ